MLGPVAGVPLTPLTPLVAGSGEMVAAAMAPIITALQHLEVGPALQLLPRLHLTCKTKRTLSRDKSKRLAGISYSTI